MSIQDRNSVNGLIKWVEEQVNADWLVVTLRYDETQDKALIERALVHTMRELEQTLVKGANLTTNKANGAGNRLRRLVALGGDYENETSLHIHLLIDGFNNIEKFTALLEKAWVNNLAREIKKASDTPFKKKSVSVFVEDLRSLHKYVPYIVRFEGKDLGNGMDKVVGDATYLS